ncbi:MAG TPA: hypothetical protein VFA11_08870 [Acidimicrobiales bacterium]|nr:hypothetical protein [Acidimicrobiales bacterium]
MRARRLGAMGLGLVTALGAVGMGAARASGPGPAGAGGVAPLNINGKHVFWARGVRSAASLSTATANNLIYHGGAVETTPKVYLTFWGSEWTDPTNPAYQIPVKSPSGSDYNLGQLQNYIVSFFSGVGGTAWNNIQTQYCQGGSIGDLTCANSSGISSVTNPSSVLAGVWNDTSAAPAVIDTLGLAENAVPDPVATEAKSAAAHFGDATDLNATFFVFAPPGRVATGATPFGAYCGYHSEVTNPSGHGLRYAFIPYLLDVDLGPGAALGSCGMNYVNKTNTASGNGIFDGFSIVSGHEYAEAVTDPDAWPFQDGWNDISTNENGDKCAWISPGQPGGATNLSLSTGQFAVQSLWSNAFNQGQGGCVVSYP